MFPSGQVLSSDVLFPHMASDRRRLRIERLLDEAEEAVGRYDWEAVRQAAQAVLVFDSDNGEALDLLTGAERAIGGTATLPPIQPSNSTPATNLTATRFQPTSFANGRYKVQRFLGEGGKKRVYLAQDTTLDREVAFALIKTEGLDDTSRTRIQREAQAMGRLGSHPHIVTVFDLGEEQGQPYMVTELMGEMGPPLASMTIRSDRHSMVMISHRDSPEHGLWASRTIRLRRGPPNNGSIGLALREHVR